MLLLLFILTALSTNKQPPETRPRRKNDGEQTSEERSSPGLRPDRNLQGLSFPSCLHPSLCPSLREHTLRWATLPYTPNWQCMYVHARVCVYMHVYVHVHAHVCELRASGASGHRGGWVGHRHVTEQLCADRTAHLHLGCPPAILGEPGA